ncbi:hypothetical protein ACJMK2_028632 [Sinanodonta woodiana]|uniref:Uncharacterized protein n=1 Tax=Sinanodonta woodiana TaxID=1069815 RepID=A0ABD3X969_SINWO
MLYMIRMPQRRQMPVSFFIVSLPSVKPDFEDEYIGKNPRFSDLDIEMCFTKYIGSQSCSGFLFSIDLFEQDRCRQRKSYFGESSLSSADTETLYQCIARPGPSIFNTKIGNQNVFCLKPDKDSLLCVSNSAIKEQGIKETIHLNSGDSMITEEMDDKNVHKLKDALNSNNFFSLAACLAGNHLVIVFKKDSKTDGSCLQEAQRIKKLLAWRVPDDLRMT